MAYKVDNAVIMAAGTASRFAPLSYERPKALIEVKGEVLIERQIRQLQEAGIPQIIVVVGYMKEDFRYLEDKFGVILVDNDSYLTRNNNASIYAAKDYIRNTYICSSDNYFNENPFESEVDEAYYAAVFAQGHTEEWCMQEDAEGFISQVQVGGEDAQCAHAAVEQYQQPEGQRFIAGHGMHLYAQIGRHRACARARRVEQEAQEVFQQLRFQMGTLRFNGIRTAR